MDRRNFMHSLMAGAALVMLPALGRAKEPVCTFEMNTVADLTAWMEHRFVCSEMEPKAFVEHKKEDLPKLYGFSADSLPKNLGAFDTFRIIPFTVAYGCEDADSKTAEKRLVQTLYEKFSELPKGTPVVWRVKPTFNHQNIAEYGDVWLSSENIEDGIDKGPIPADVELDFDTGHYKQVKRRFTLNKVRMRFSLPTIDSDFKHTVGTTEGSSPIRI